MFHPVDTGEDGSTVEDHIIFRTATDSSPQECTGFPTGRFRIRAAGPPHYYWTLRWYTAVEGNLLGLWGGFNEYSNDFHYKSQIFFVNSAGHLCNDGGLELDISGSSIILTGERQRTEPWPNPWSHPLPTFLYAADSRTIAVKLYSDPVVSDEWPRPEREWKDKEFAVAAASVAPTQGLKFEEIERWAPVNALSTRKWSDHYVGFGPCNYCNVGVEEKAGDLSRMEWELEPVDSNYVIFMVGRTGADKTWFTGQLLNTHDIQVSKMAGLPYGSNVTAWKWKLNNGANIVVVNMPSFHVDRDDDDVNNTMADWLQSNFTKKYRPGMLFLHSLDSDPTRDGMLTSLHLETFAKALPDGYPAPSRVYVVPTSNVDSTLSSKVLSQRLLQLKTVAGGLNGVGNCKWHASMFPGVFKGQPEMAWSVVLMLLKDISQNQTEESISPRIEPTLRRMSPNSPNDRLALKNFADLLFKVLKQIGQNSDLDAITTLGRTALELSSPGHPQHHSTLTDLPELLLEQFKKEETRADSGEITALKRAALECIPQNHPRRQTILLELDDFLYERFRREDSIADLEEIISLRRAVLELTHPPDRCRQLLNLANSLYEKFEKLHFVNDIDGAVSLAVDALGLCCPGQPDYPLSQDHLASYLKAKVRTRDARVHASDTSSSVPVGIEQLVKRVFVEKAEKLPPRLLHTPTGVLCNRDAQLSHFKHSPQYKQLLLSTSPSGSPQLETEINDTISEFLGFTMLSHRWGDCEPLLCDIESKRIYDLGGTDGLAKLQNFCILALRRSFHWAWSDTCCIDKDSSAELQEAIGSMFLWYHRSSLTIVYLADVTGTGSLSDSVWFERGWTLQELLASNTVLFYAQDWSPYAKSDAANHKTAPVLLEELCKATQISAQHLRNFDAGTEDARSRLCWASRRRTTRPEDMAYSLFGIFKVQMPVLYGESAQNALGRLLVEIISGSGDVSVLDWVGKQSSFNSCFPVDLVPYQIPPCIQLIPSGPPKRERPYLEKARTLYSDLAKLPLARCVHKRISLPSIIHQVTAVTRKVSSDSPSRYAYQIHASRLTPLEVTSSVNLDEGAGKYILVRPWHPKSLQMQTGSDNDAIWNLLDRLEQPFNALLLERLLHNEYKRIACDCTITACVQETASILDSEVLTLEVV